MSQFDLPDPNDRVLEEEIEWDSILNETAHLLVCSVLKTKLMHDRQSTTNKDEYLAKNKGEYLAASS